MTYFVVQTFQQGKRGAFLPDNPEQVSTKGQAERTAERLSRRSAGVIAFSRTGDPDTGDWDEAVIIAEFGTVPVEWIDVDVAV
jgi:hypothetical protein